MTSIDLNREERNLMELSLQAYVWARSLVSSLASDDEAGEGVISTAMAVCR